MKRRSAILPSCLIVVVIVLFLGVLLGAWVISDLPDKAERTFGPPADSLDPVQHTYLSAELLLYVDDLRHPYDTLGEERPFRVQLGESTYVITERLQAEGFIPNAEALRFYLLYTGLDTTLQAGEYTLNPRMTPMEIAHALQDATPGEITFRILPGWRAEEIAAALPTSGLGFTPKAFMASVAHPPQGSSLMSQLPLGASLEGFFFPDSYRLPREIPVEEFIATLLENFQIKVDQELQSGFQRQGLDLFQAVTLASIVQRETIVEDEMPLIASVFINRLAASIKLDADSTVQYALGFNSAQDTWWTNPLRLDDLQIESPYNTYLYAGLPPTPIANPGLKALTAVALPAQTPYYYFRAACDNSGRHSFAETFEEHQSNACP